MKQFIKLFAGYDTKKITGEVNTFIYINNIDVINIISNSSYVNERCAQITITLIYKWVK